LREALHVITLRKIDLKFFAESSRQVLEELAVALQESRKEYIANHLIKNAVTDDNFDSIRSLVKT